MNACERVLAGIFSNKVLSVYTIGWRRNNFRINYRKQSDRDGDRNKKPNKPRKRDIDKCALMASVFVFTYYSVNVNALAYVHRLNR